MARVVLYRGLVTDTTDPSGQRRARADVPILGPGKSATPWAKIYTAPAGALNALPEVGDEVLVTFELGNLNSPIVP